MKLVAILPLAALTMAPAQADAPVAAEAVAYPSPYFLPLDLVELIECTTPDGAQAFSGSGARVDTDLIITASHVVSGFRCTVRGEPVKVEFDDRAADFAVIRVPTSSMTRMPISCAPVREGEAYFATGYAFGKDFAVQALTGTRSIVRGPRFTGLGFLRGNIYPGMSGGPIVDARGHIVAIVNAAPRNGQSVALARELRTTFLCADAAEGSPS